MLPAISCRNRMRLKSLTVFDKFMSWSIVGKPGRTMHGHTPRGDPIRIKERTRVELEDPHIGSIQSTSGVLMNITSPNCLFPWPRLKPVPPYRCCDVRSVTARFNSTKLIQMASPSIFCDLESCVVKVMWEHVHLTNRCFGVDGSQSRASQRLLARAQSPTPPIRPPDLRDRPSTQKNAQSHFA